MSDELQIWAVVLGWNHAEDTIECMQSLAASRDVNLNLVYIDNGSEQSEVQKVLDALPQAHVVKHVDEAGASHNVGVSRGFNGGLKYALEQGADYIFMANNDTAVDPECVKRCLDTARTHPEAGILVPKIFYWDDTRTVWSAGAKYRRFPPVIVMRKTSGPDDGRFDQEQELEFTTLCTVLVKADALKEAGLMSSNFLFYCEDYDLAVRVREAGYTVRYVPTAESKHKVARVTREGPSKPAFWVTYGRSEAIFQRLHKKYWWMTGPFHNGYVILRSLVEGKWMGMTHWLKGRKEGLAVELKATPRYDDGSVDRTEVVRAPEKVTA